MSQNIVVSKETAELLKSLAMKLGLKTAGEVVTLSAQAFVTGLEGMSDLITKKVDEKVTVLENVLFEAYVHDKLKVEGKVVIPVETESARQVGNIEIKKLSDGTVEISPSKEVRELTGAETHTIGQQVVKVAKAMESTAKIMDLRGYVLQPNEALEISQEVQRRTASPELSTQLEKDLEDLQTTVASSIEQIDAGAGVPVEEVRQHIEDRRQEKLGGSALLVSKDEGKEILDQVVDLAQHTPDSAQIKIVGSHDYSVEELAKALDMQEAEKQLRKKRREEAEEEKRFDLLLNPYKANPCFTPADGESAAELEKKKQVKEYVAEVNALTALLNGFGFAMLTILTKASRVEFLLSTDNSSIRDYLYNQLDDRKEWLLKNCVEGIE